MEGHPAQIAGILIDPLERSVAKVRAQHADGFPERLPPAAEGLGRGMHARGGQVVVHQAELLRTGQPYPQIVVEGELEARIQETYLAEGFASKKDRRLADDAFATQSFEIRIACREAYTHLVIC